MLPDELSGRTVVPLFPLPGAVLFPETVLPLHVFEPRYRALVRHALARDRRLAIVLLRHGPRGPRDVAPPIHEVATVGRIENLRPLPDGRFLLDVVGATRVRLVEIDSDRPFRLARALALPETFPTAAQTERAESRKVELLASLGLLTREISSHTEGSLALDARLPLRAAINGSCANLPVEAAVRQQLLEIDDLLQRQAAALRVAEALLERVLADKAGSQPGAN